MASDYDVYRVTFMTLIHKKDKISDEIRGMSKSVLADKFGMIDRSVAHDTYSTKHVQVVFVCCNTCGVIYVHNDLNILIKEINVIDERRACIGKARFLVVPFVSCVSLQLAVHHVCLTLKQCKENAGMKLKIPVVSDLRRSESWKKCESHVKKVSLCLCVHDLIVKLYLLFMLKELVFMLYTVSKLMSSAVPLHSIER